MSPPSGDTDGRAAPWRVALVAVALVGVGFVGGVFVHSVVASTEPADPAALKVNPGDPTRTVVLRDDQARLSSDLFFLGDSVVAAMDLDQYFPGRAAVNRGVGRNTTSEMLERLDGTVLVARPACVVIMGGVNDLSFGRAGDWITAAFDEIVNTSLAAGAKVVLVTTPQPAGGELAPFVPDDRRRALNDWLRARAVADPTRVMVADFGAMADDMGAVEFETLTIDGYHLAPAGYGALAELVEPLLPACLDRDG